jgi:hypothetical protein
MPDAMIGYFYKPFFHWAFTRAWEFKKGNLRGLLSSQENKLLKNMNPETVSAFTANRLLAI